ncbi:putative Phosducin-like protein [Venustampulla echinocandica]|uniref:Putative Phosducin-like protein n=1 Tax=Venustampulla echinocandica TaxID=2656787 RepID=A0A370TVF0_9HELO|nr:putative Phosducin-like protein [Venustampulla echinocandica]RDL39501.1 putative Phosducin-like protein [Venustampulla echinocandica]
MASSNLQQHSNQTPAQEEFDSIINRSLASEKLDHHPADRDDYRHDRETGDRDEEDEYIEKRVNDNMRMPATYDNIPGSGSGGLKLPHRDFDHGRTTGVKGVIADARNYEEARRNGSYRRNTSRSPTSKAEKRSSTMSFLKDDGEDSDDEDEEFLERWRQQRRMQLEKEGGNIRNRRTSPSVRRYGRFDEVDAMGYLDAIERVTRDTIVVVFVYDSDCPVSRLISDALSPLVSRNPHIRFVRIHYEEIEFDNAGVPAILGYKNQGDLFANLTYIIDQIPEDTPFDTKALENVLRNHKVLP